MQAAPRVWPVYNAGASYKMVVSKIKSRCCAHNRHETGSGHDGDPTRGTCPHYHDVEVTLCHILLCTLSYYLFIMRSFFRWNGGAF